MAARAHRALALLLLTAVVLLAHGLLARSLPVGLGGAGGEAMPRRIEVAFVTDLAPTAPVPMAAPLPAAAPRARAAAPARPASAPQDPAAGAEAPKPAEVPAAVPAEAPPEKSAEAPPDRPLELQPPVRAEVALPGAAAEVAAPPPMASAPAVAAAPLAAASASPAARPFEWPPSTRLSYRLTGNYRGEVHGTAQVEWVRVEQRYQVHLDVVVGPAFAPIVSRRMTSDGELSDQGLKPQRYDEDTKALFREARRRSILFEPQRIVLPGGREREAVDGVQDTASQFVQLTWMFTTRPQLLQVGRTVELPLALASGVDRWVYDVLDKASVDTPVGPVEAFHLKPRREAKANADMVAEAWYAPSLQYLPVRLRIRQDAETYIDLLLDRAPQQAAAAR